ncbi:acyl-ACP--UDP-N-acetylglucosamine O-acyltransferase [Desulfurobacterium atlanticum]|uniref:Acyl-[acyl-carrier-protein]--UDP-N-acetylglucosamine O-acyltransferase n=1 Tax=Desulfurobacterium atlanticum TaxID=240169 RepID=A0A238XU03_9BACT|nr:acyl-ACP--UDP-N-acetylglucosamine O-acyltransferase [Desulfurobacterium atlanticum]SNR62190.1 acyl-[acyl-carrier-protein]--UDP-N-acetylglucosamine O-acyltransferase [Desulfurobacterium atlanticum]
MSVNIHKLAVVEKGAELDDGVIVGPFAFVGKDVKVGKDTIIKTGAVIEGKTTIGEKCTIYSATIGVAPQDLKYKGESSEVVIGNRTVIREYATIHRGTEGGGMVTKVGDECLIMAYSHVAHDCKLGNHVILANVATLAGHVEVGDWAIIGGMSGVHQFVRIGKHAMIGGASAVARDVPPFTVAIGNRAKLEGINLIGLKRRGFSKETIRALATAFEMVFKTDEPLRVSLEKVKEEFQDIPEIIEFVEFIEKSKRGVCTA